MNQDIKVEFYEKNKWNPIISSFPKINNGLFGEAKRKDNKGKEIGEPIKFSVFDIRFRPYLAVSFTAQDGIIPNMILSIGNPNVEIAKNLVGRLIKVSIGYTNIKNQNFETKMFPIFIGMVVQPPYFSDSGQGTDQVLNIPLTMSAMPQVLPKGYKATIVAGESLDSALKKIFKDNPYSCIQTLKYTNEKILKDQPIKHSFNVDFRKENFTSILRHFRTNEGIILNTNNGEILFITNDELREKEILGEQTGDTNVELNAGVIFNRKEVTRPEAYVNTYIKTKFAVLAPDNSLNLELAVALPNLVSRRYAIIENLGTNINIYESIKGQSDLVDKNGNNANQSYSPKKGDKIEGRAFYIMRQQVFFSTFGDSKHTLCLLANPSEKRKKEIMEAYLDDIKIDKTQSEEG